MRKSSILKLFTKDMRSAHIATEWSFMLLQKGMFVTHFSKRIRIKVANTKCMFAMIVASNLQSSQLSTIISTLSMKLRRSIVKCVVKCLEAKFIYRITYPESIRRRPRVPFVVLLSEISTTTSRLFIQKMKGRSINVSSVGRVSETREVSMSTSRVSTLT